MASIEESIRLVDGISPVLRAMANAIDQTSNSLSAMRRNAQKTGVGVDGLHDTVERMTMDAGSVNSVARSIANVGRQADAAKQSVSGLSGVIGQVKGAFSSAIGQFAIGNLAANAITALVSALSEVPGKLARASDEYAGMQARLKLVTGSAEAAAEMNDRIFESAMRARGSYDGMLSNVAKIAMTAKAAFPDPKQVVPFVEGIQKLFTIGGTGIQEQKDAMLQLTQALGSGRLQGDEFRSIAEAAPLIEQMIAKEMGVAQGELKQLGAQGEITADIVKSAIFNNMDDINERFRQMPLTFGQIAQQMGNVVQRAFSPIYRVLSEIANGETMRSFMESVAQGLTVAGSALAAVIVGLSDVASMAINAGSYIAGWIEAGVTVAEQALETLDPAIFTVFGLYLGYLATVATGWVIANGPALIHAGIETLLAAKTVILTAATAAWTAVTKGMAAAQMMLNVVLLANPIDIVIGAAVAAIGIFMAWRSATVGLKTTIAEAFRAIANIVQGAVNIMISAVNGLIKVLDVAAGGINKVFGTHIGTIGEIGHVSGWGDKAYNFIQNAEWKKMLPSFSMPSQDMPDYSGLSGSLGDIAASGKSTADNTEKMADSIDMLDEDLSYLREIAERNAINRYTTVSVAVEMGGVTNQVSNDMDIDGVVDRLTEGIQRSMQNAAQEVHI